MFLDPLYNLLNAAIGRKQDFEQLIESRDISRIKQQMDDHSLQISDAMREYNPKLHRINLREDKIIMDKKGNFKRKIKRWKLPVDYPKYINEVALVFIYGQPPKWGQTSEGTDDAFKAFNDLVRKTHFNAKLRQCKRIAGACTQSAMLFRVFRNEDGKADCQIKVLNPMKGDEIYTRWDQYDNIISMGWGYYLNEGGTTSYRFDLFTRDTIYHCKQGGIGGWDVVPEENLIGKIPLILFQQDKEWAGAEPLIYREEYIASRTADTNDYFADPMLILDADIVKNMPEKDDENKTLIKKSGESTQAAAGYLTWDSAPQSKKDEIEWLQNHILSKTFTPNIDFENMKSLSNVTGKALKQMMVLANIKASKHKETHDELLQRAGNLMRAIIGNVLDVSLASQCENLDLTHEFQDPFGEDIAEVIDNLTKAKDAGIVSTETAVEKSPLTDDPQREMERLAEDGEKRTAEQKDIFAQFRNEEEGLVVENEDDLNEAV